MMLLLSAPFDPAAAAPPRSPLRPFGQTGAAAALVVGLGAGAEMLGAAPAGLGRALATGAAHGGLLGLGWLLATGAAPGWSGPVVRLGVIMTLVSVAARIVPWGAGGFALMPLLLLFEAHRRPALRGLGMVLCRPRHALVGLAAGGFLGAHLLITASLTFGHRVHSSSLAGLVSTALALVRYLLDPALPHAVEARAGAVFYLGLVGLIGCALRAWSGSLFPGYLAGLAFFAAYRTLAP